MVATARNEEASLFMRIFIGVLPIVACFMMLLVSFAQVDDQAITLESIEITGNREQPKALFIVPWQPPPTADSLYRPIRGYLDGILEPVEREAFLRELDFYQQLRNEQQIVTDDR